MVTAGPVRHDIDVNGWPAILCAVILGTIGVLSFIIQPGIVQGYVTQLKVDEATAVNLAGVEMLGVALATIFMAVRGTQINWRCVVAGGLLIAAAGDLARSARRWAGGSRSRGLSRGWARERSLRSASPSWA